MLQPLLDVAELSRRFPVGKRQVHAVDDVSFTLHRGEALGLVGESGCGKSTLVRTLARLLDPTKGIIRFNGRELTQEPAARFARDKDRARIQVVFQDAGESINLRYTAADAIADPLRRLCGLRGAALRHKTEEAARLCGLEPALLGRFTHQLSEGQRARVGIARAVAPRPDLLILDEPTAELDVSVQITVLKLLAELRATLGMAYIFVSHDLNVSRLLCDRVLVMYLGRVMESGPAQAVFDHPLHSYTQSLIAAIPRLTGERQKATAPQGEPRSPIDPDPNACRFHGRCPVGTPRCGTEMPALRPFPGTREAACHFAEAL